MAKWFKNGKSEKEIVEADAEVRKTVEKILRDVVNRGDEAVRELSIKFDNYSPDNFILSQEEIDIAISKVSEKDLDDVSDSEFDLVLDLGFFGLLTWHNLDKGTIFSQFKLNVN